MDKGDRHFGVVAIGRNEGERLKRSLGSIPRNVPVVYVDSASSDGSVEFAREWGATVVELDLSTPFTAARARNEGAACLLASHPACAFVQFVDGDCEFEPGWFEKACSVLTENHALAAVCGRRRERFPDATFFNQLCDEEWNTPVGPADACGGDALVRVEAFQAVGGYDPAMIAGEEPEMCHRLRKAGWKIERIDAAMTIHDADMHSAKQWWMRAVRSGFGYAQVWSATASSGLAPLYRIETVRALFWTIGVAFVALIGAAVIGPAGLCLAPAIWLLQYARLGLRSGWRRGWFQLLAKLAEAWGILRFAAARLLRKRSGAIYYK